MVKKKIINNAANIAKVHLKKYAQDVDKQNKQLATHP